MYIISRHLKLFFIIWVNASTIIALNPIVIKGQKFFDSITKDQFFIKGVSYQPRGDDQTIYDPLANAEACTRDVPLIKDLGANVVRVYEVDPSQNHDECMQTLADHEIYLVLDISTRTSSIRRENPTYDVPLYNAYRSIVSSFIHYPHVLAFIAGNEVITNKSNSYSAPYVKAVIRDMKTVIRQNGNRTIPVGYASNDDPFIRESIKDFFACGDDSDSQADFFGVNLYEWCGRSSFGQSGYADRTREFESYGKPVFLSEYGCNSIRPRSFDEVEAIFGPLMTPIWSGGVAYEWSQEVNDYGLVRIVQGQVQLLEDYDNLQKMLKVTDPKGVKMDEYVYEQIKKPCPSITDHWKASAILPPTPSQGACTCMKENLRCVSSDAVVLSTSNATVGSQIDTMCGLINCNEIRGDGEERGDGIEKYGIFSFCSPEEKLSRLFDIFVAQTPDNSASNQCDFNGYARPLTPKWNNITLCSSIKPDTSLTSHTRLQNMASAKTSPSILVLSSLIILKIWL